MIRVLFVSTSTTVGGAEKTLFHLATRLDPSRFAVAGVVSVKSKGDVAYRLEHGGVPTQSLKADAFPGPGSLRRLSGLVEETKPDVVLAIMFKAMQLARAVKRLSGKRFKLVTSPRVHYRTRSFPSLWVDRALRGQDDLLIAESDASRTYLESLGYESRKLLTIRNGVEAAAKPAADDRRRLRAELGVGPDDILLGAVGRLDRQKGHAYLLEAVAKLRVLHPVRCVIVGEGPLEGELWALAESLRIRPFIRFAGKQEDLRPWHAAMDIFVQPSLWEGLPNAVLEAMACGLPIVATNVDGTPEAIEHHVNGLLYEPGDSQALFAAVQDMIARPNDRSEMAQAGPRVASERFGLGAMISAYQSAFERAAAGA